MLFTLVDHIYNAVTSAEKGIFVPNTMLTDIQRFYADEYATGEVGIDVIYRNFGVQLKKDEAGFIAMHFVMAGTSDAKSDITRMLEIIHELDSLITRELSLDVDASSLTYFRYMTHLKFFAESQSSTYIILFAASNIIFYFMPVFLAYTTATAMKCSKINSTVLGAFLCYPQIDALVQDTATASTFSGEAVTCDVLFR